MHPWFYAKLAQKILNVLHSRFQTKCPRVESDKKKKSLKEKSEELRCPYCDIIQSNKSSLSYHITTIHYPPNLNLYENKNLSQGYRNRYNLIDEPSVSCNFCEMDKKLSGFGTSIYVNDFYQFNKTIQEFEFLPGAAQWCLRFWKVYGLFLLPGRSCENLNFPTHSS